MTVKRIGVEESVFSRLLEYKNKRALIGKKSKYSFTDAINDLLLESETLSEWMKGKNGDPLAPLKKVLE